MKFYHFALVAILFVFGIGVQNVYAADWFDSDWTYAKKVTIDSAQVDATLTDFTVLVDITDTDISAEAQPDCDDIMFIDSTHTTQYDHEIEDCDLTTNDVLTAWVQIPSVSSSTDTEFYLYYGNSLATNQEDITGTWNSNYLAVYHLHDDFLDSTSNNNDGTNSGSTDTNGYIADGQEFDGLNDEVDFGDFAEGLTAITVSAWSHTDIDTADGMIFGKFSGAPYSWLMWYDDATGSPCTPGQKIAFFVGNSGGTNGRACHSVNYSANTWYHSTGTWNAGNTIKMYVDGNSGTAGDSLSGTMGSNAATVKIGEDANNARDLDGKVDELRIMNIAVSEEWNNAEYENQKSGSTFISLGSEETEPTGPTISVSDGMITGDSISETQIFGESVSDGMITGDSSSSSKIITEVVSDGAIMGESYSDLVNMLIEKSVSDGMITGNSASTNIIFALVSNVSDGIIIGDGQSTNIIGTITVGVSDGMITGDSLAAMTTLTLGVSDGMITGDSVFVNLFGDIPLGVSDGIITGDGLATQFICAGTCSKNVSDGMIVGDISLDTDVTITTFNSIKLYVNSPATDRLGGVFSQSCNVGDYVSGIDTTGAIICTALP